MPERKRQRRRAESGERESKKGCVLRSWPYPGKGYVQLVAAVHTERLRYGWIGWVANKGAWITSGQQMDRHKAHGTDTE